MPRAVELSSPQKTKSVDSGERHRTPSSSGCPVCGDGAEFHWRFDKKGRHFYRCTTCKLEKQVPLPTLAELQAYYDGEFDHGMYETFTSAEKMKEMTATRRMKEISPLIPQNGRWLDVGCANGVFVNHANNSSEAIRAEGLELSDIAVKQAVAKGLNVRCGAIENMENEPVYDCITAFDVLEHVIDPRAFVQDIADRLTPGGHAALTLPNHASIFSKLMGPRWWFYIPEEHLHYFDPKNLATLVENAGLEVLTISRTFKPLSFDYGLTQFIEFNPLIYKVLKAFSVVLPSKIRQMIIPFYIGEMKIIAKKP